MDDLALKPCPHCGARELQALDFRVHCKGPDGCGAFGPWRLNTAEAITAWNTRAADRIEALSGRREEIARIIDPGVWAIYDATTDRTTARKLTSSSLRKADAILALISPTTESPK